MMKVVPIADVSDYWKACMWRYVKWVVMKDGEAIGGFRTKAEATAFVENGGDEQW